MLPPTSSREGVVVATLSGGPLAAARSAIKRELRSIRSQHPDIVEPMLAPSTVDRVRNLRRALIALDGEPFAPEWLPEVV